jgi:hypothetical protein
MPTTGIATLTTNTKKSKKKRKFLCSTDRARQKAMQPSPSKEEQYTQRGEPTTGDFARAVKQ